MVRPKLQQLMKDSKGPCSFYISTGVSGGVNGFIGRYSKGHVLRTMVLLGNVVVGPHRRSFVVRAWCHCMCRYMGPEY